MANKVRSVSNRNEQVKIVSVVITLMDFLQRNVIQLLKDPSVL